MKGETCNFISTATSSLLPAIAPREEISLGSPSGILPFCFGWESHLCPRTVRNGILPGNGTYRQPPGSWTRTTIEPGTILFPMIVWVNRCWIDRRLHKAEVLLNGDRIAIHPNSRKIHFVRMQFPCQFHVLPPIVIPTIQSPEIVQLAGTLPMTNVPPGTQTSSARSFGFCSNIILFSFLFGLLQAFPHVTTPRKLSLETFSVAFPTCMLSMCGSPLNWHHHFTIIWLLSYVHRFARFIHRTTLRWKPSKPSA